MVVAVDFGLAYLVVGTIGAAGGILASLLAYKTRQQTRTPEGVPDMGTLIATHVVQDTEIQGELVRLTRQHADQLAELLGRP